jgi:predicted transcriptional regulator
MTEGPKMVTVSVRLDERVVSLLDDLVDAYSSTRERILTPLIEREYAARKAQLNTPAPWTITEEAITQASQITGGRAGDREQIRDVLETACVDAVLAEREGRRKPTQRRDGTWQYRGPKPQRFTLIVEKTVNGKNALIGVTRSGA